MSSYGPPGAPYSGQAPDQWQGAPSPYGQPQDPFSGPPYAGDQWDAGQQTPPQWAGGQPPQQYPAQQYLPQQPVGYAQPGYDQRIQPNYGGDTDWEPPRKRSSGLITTLVILFVVLLLGGAGLVYVLLQDNNSGGGNPSVCTTAPGADPHCFTVGQCLRNVGTQDAPSLQIATCDAGAFKVVQRFDGTHDSHKCDGVKDSDQPFFYDQFNSDDRDVVLCLHKL
jgi:hypothetical protein